MNTSTQNLPKPDMQVKNVPKDYTYGTTLVCKGKLPPKGFIWMELKIVNWNNSRKSIGRFAVRMPKTLTNEQRDYFAARFRLAVKERTGR